MVKKMKNPKDSRNLLQCKKAISPILATLLLIVLVVAAGIAAYAWIQSSATSQMTQASGFIIIENVRFYDGDQVELVIRNTGTADVKVDTVYIDEVGNTVEQNIAAKGSSTFVIDYSWEIGTRYKIKVVSTAGLFAEGLYNTPSQAHVWYDQSWTRRKAATIDNTLNTGLKAMLHQIPLQCGLRVHLFQPLLRKRFTCIMETPLPTQKVTLITPSKCL